MKGIKSNERWGEGRKAEVGNRRTDYITEQ